MADVAAKMEKEKKLAVAGRVESKILDSALSASGHVEKRDAVRRGGAVSRTGETTTTTRRPGAGSERSRRERPGPKRARAVSPEARGRPKGHSSGGFVKKFKLDDPKDWTRYADDPDGVASPVRKSRAEDAPDHLSANPFGEIRIQRKERCPQVMNRRRLTREERRRQFQVSLAVGDPKECAPRDFEPLFEERGVEKARVSSYAFAERGDLACSNWLL